MEINSHSFKDRRSCEKCELETNVIQKQKVANRLNTIKYMGLGILLCHKQLAAAAASRFSRVRLCVTPETAAHQAPPSLGFSRQEHWSGLPFPSPMHESEK